jgi:hypothetical protein
MVAHAQNATGAATDKVKAAIAAARALGASVQPGSRIIIAICPPGPPNPNACDLFSGVPVPKQ